MSQLQVAIKQIEKRIRTMSYSRLIIGSLIVGILSTLSVLAFQPQLVSLGFLPSFKYTLGMTSLTVFIIMVLVVFDSFYWAYVPIAERKISGWKSRTSSIIKLFKNADIITSENTDRQEYNQKLFEKLLTDEKPTIWKWLGQMFVHIERKFREYDNKIGKLKSSGITKMHSCEFCRTPFELYSPDSDYTIPMLNKCSICNTLDQNKWITWGQNCPNCRSITIMGWHHKDEHSYFEKIRAKIQFHKVEN